MHDLQKRIENLKVAIITKRWIVWDFPTYKVAKKKSILRGSIAQVGEERRKLNRLPPAPLPSGAAVVRPALVIVIWWWWWVVVGAWSTWGPGATTVCFSSMLLPPWKVAAVFIPSTSYRFMPTLQAWAPTTTTSTTTTTDSSPKRKACDAPASNVYG